MRKMMAIAAGALILCGLIGVTVVSCATHYMPPAADARYTAAEFTAIAKGITTQDECLAVLGEPGAKRVRVAPGGNDTIVGEQWVYLKLVKDQGLRLDANFFWDAETKKVQRIRLFNMEADGTPIPVE
jgi:hypothetical protein